MPNVTEEKRMWLLPLDSCEVKCFCWEEVERFAGSIAQSRAYKNKTTKEEEFNKIIAQVLTDNGDN